MASGDVVLVEATLPDDTRSGPVDITVRNGLIAAIEPSRSSADHQLPVVAAGDAIVTPGLIDLHIHGAFGASFGDSDPEALDTVTQGLVRRGITTVQASLVSQPTEQLSTMINTLAARLGPRPGHATIAGVHLEGPFLATAQAGAHDPVTLRSPTVEDRELISTNSETLTMITLAPEVPGVLELIDRCRQLGIVAAVGHSDGDQDAFDAAVAAGAEHVTHLWSGQSMVTRRGPWRVPGMLESSLASDLTAEIIADGKHLPPTLLEIARRCLGDRLTVVSDATPGAGMPDGYSYPLGTVCCRVSDGVGMVEGQPAFGGSTTLLDDMVRYLVIELGWPLADVLAMVTSVPAAVLGRTDIGNLDVGSRADLVLWERDLSLRQVFLAGQKVRQAPS